MEIEKLIKDFLFYYQNEAENILSKNTIDAYRRDLKKFSCFIVKKELNIETIKKNDLNEFKEGLKLKYKISSVNRLIIVLNRFFDYLKREKKSDLDLKIKIIKIQQQNFKIDLLKNLDVERVLRIIERKNDIRAKALLLSLFYTGARISEILQIKKEDINQDKINIKGKGSKYRFLYIPKKLKKIWNEYLKERKENEKYKTNYLFTGDRGNLTRTTVNSILKYYTGQARVKKNKMHPHALRHLYTKNMFKLGVNPAVIKQLLGHSLNTTDLYLSYSEKELFEVINRLNYKGN